MDYVVAATLLVGVLVLAWRNVRRVTILEYERGLGYRQGKFHSILEPGQYWYLPFRVIVIKLDIRPRFVSITGQELLSSDGVALKVSLVANFEISDPRVAVNQVQNFQEALYLELQLALREVIGAQEIERILSNRNELSVRVQQIAEPKIAQLGLRLISVSLKDIMFPGKLKEVFAQVVNARQEGLAALEKARGETAALRNLSNAARLIDGNPNLLQLRLVQVLGQTSGNTLVLGLPAHGATVPIVRKVGEEGPELPSPTRESPPTD